MTETPTIDGVDREAPTAHGLGARGLSGLLSACDRARALTSASANPDAVAVDVFGQEPIRRGPLSVAAMCGHAFELSLTGKHARRLVDAYVSAGVIADSDTVETLDMSLPDAPTDEQIAASVDGTVTSAVNALDSGRTVLIVQPSLWLAVGGRRHLIHPDGLWVRDGSVVISEIKTYLDRDAFTDPVAFTSAVQQTAVGVVAAEGTFDASGHSVRVAHNVDLVFRHQSWSGVSIRTVDATPEIAAIQSQVHVSSGVADTIDPTSASSIASIPHSYVPLCDRVCGMAVVCRDEADRTLGRSGVHGHPALAVLDASGVTVETAVSIATGDQHSDEPFAQFLRDGWNAVNAAPVVTATSAPTNDSVAPRRRLSPSERRAQAAS